MTTEYQAAVHRSAHARWITLALRRLDSQDYHRCLHATMWAARHSDGDEYALGLAFDIADRALSLAAGDCGDEDPVIAIARRDVSAAIIYLWPDEDEEASDS